MVIPKMSESTPGMVVLLTKQKWSKSMADVRENASWGQGRVLLTKVLGYDYSSVHLG